MAFYTFIILVFVVLGRPQDFFPFLASFRLALIFTIISLLLTIFSNSDKSLSKIFSIKEGKLYLVFFLTMVVGIPFAFHKGYAFECIFFKYLADIFFFYLFLAHVKSTKKIKLTLFVVIISLVFQACMSLVQGNMQYGRFYPGTMYDPNDLAYFFVSFIPIFFLFNKKKEKLITRILSLFGFLMAFVIILLTGSRGGLIGLVVVLFFLIFSKIAIEKASLKILLVVVLALFFVLNFDKINIERFQSILNITSDYNVTSDTGRFSIWRSSMTLFLENPITGVGVCCFKKAIGLQKKKEGKVGKWQSPHNSYVQILAEIGFIGFFVFLSLIFTSLRNFHVLSRLGPKGDNSFSSYTQIAGFLKLGFIGSLICATFLSQGYSTIFTMYFALSAVLRSIADEEVDGI